MPVTVECPFYKWDQTEKRGKKRYTMIYCEGGKLCMPDVEQKTRYLKSYCANPELLEKMLHREGAFFLL